MKVQTEQKGVVRDTDSKALLNRNHVERDRIQAAREKARKSAQLENRVDALEREVEELKKLIHGNQV